MNNNMKIKEKKQPVLTAAGILAVALGLILVYFGFFMLMESNTAIGPQMTKTERSITRYLAIAGIYLMANGVCNGIGGFFGAVNSGSEEYVKKVTKYGWILLGFSVCNVILLSILTDIIGNRFNMLILLVPIAISVMYCVGAFFNVRLVKRKCGE